MPTNVPSSSAWSLGVLTPLVEWIDQWTEPLRTIAPAPFAWMRLAWSRTASSDDPTAEHAARFAQWEERLAQCEAAMAQIIDDVALVDATLCARIDALESRSLPESEDTLEEAVPALTIGDASHVRARGRTAMFRDVLSRAQQVAKAQGLVGTEPPAPPRGRRQRKAP